jgi:signal peptidase I
MAMITALSVLTGGNVFWELRETGTAITSDQLCGKQAHEHSADCYDDSGTLKCGMDEHIHSNECFSDMKADVETPEIWEKTFAVSNEASKREQTVMIAETQLGYAESKNNFVISEDGKQQGYTRYGEWYGNAYGDWNTMFTYFCMYYACVSEDEIPYGGNARTWQAKLIENKMLHPPDSEPCRGNIVLLDTDTDGKADRTGIISNTEDRLKIIEGDHDNAVAEVEYQLNDPQILGYVSLPEPENPVEAEAVPITFSAESPSGIQVNASADEGTFPPDAVMIVEDVSPEEALQTADDLAAEKVGRVFASVLTSPQYLIYILILVCVMTFVRGYLVPSGSMIPTLREGDRILTLKRYLPDGQTYARGDIVCFHRPVSGEVYVKRIVAIGGDNVVINDQGLFVNGNMSPYQGGGTSTVTGTWNLGDDEYFMMGDNRSNSEDSRYIGPIKAKALIGKVTCVYWPINRFEMLGGSGIFGL